MASLMCAHRTAHGSNANPISESSELWAPVVVVKGRAYLVKGRAYLVKGRAYEVSSAANVDAEKVGKGDAVAAMNGW